MKWVLGLCCLLLLNGCILGGNDTGLASEMRAAREAAVPNGLLVPSSPAAQNAYSATLFSFRDRVSSSPIGLSPLEHYLEGSRLAIVSVQTANEALSNLVSADQSLLACGPGQPGSVILQGFSDAQQAALDAKAHFEAVRENVEITNALGAEYVLQALQTLEGMSEAHQNLHDQVELTCIPS